MSRHEDIIYAPIRKRVTSTTTTTQVVMRREKGKYLIWCRQFGGFVSNLNRNSMTREECRQRVIEAVPEKARRYYEIREAGIIQVMIRTIKVCRRLITPTKATIRLRSPLDLEHG